jgi:hypothetical protein
VLDKDDGCLFVKERSQQPGQFIVVFHRFQAHQDNIRFRHVFRPPESLHFREDEVAVATVYPQPVLFDIFVIAVQEETHCPPGPGQPTTEESPDGTCPYYRITKHNALFLGRFADDAEGEIPEEEGLFRVIEIDPLILNQIRLWLPVFHSGFPARQPLQYAQKFFRKLFVC